MGRPRNVVRNGCHVVPILVPSASGQAHAVFKTPWPGNPRVNIQKSKDGNAKSYQVRQVLKAIDKVQEEQK